MAQDGNYDENDGSKGVVYISSVECLSEEGKDFLSGASIETSFNNPCKWLDGTKVYKIGQSKISGEKRADFDNRLKYKGRLHLECIHNWKSEDCGRAEKAVFEELHEFRRGHFFKDDKIVGYEFFEFTDDDLQAAKKIIKKEAAVTLKERLAEIERLAAAKVASDKETKKLWWIIAIMAAFFFAIFMYDALYPPVTPVVPAQTYQPVTPVAPAQTYQPITPAVPAQTYQPVTPVMSPQELAAKQEAQKILIDATPSDAEAQYRLGMQYYDGISVEQNCEEAARLLLLSAKQGNVDAQSNIGVLYYTGQGLKVDNKQALFWTRNAVEQGHIGAQNNLGVFFYEGKALPKNDSKAFYWFNEAAALGNTQSKAFLSSFEPTDGSRIVIKIDGVAPALPNDTCIKSNSKN